MKITKQLAGLTVAGLMLVSSAAFAAPTKGYQVTGPVLELTDSTIVIQKGDEKWSIARNKDTKVDGDLKVGAKVTIHYSMTATDIEVKGEKPAKKK